MTHFYISKDQAKTSKKCTCTEYWLMLCIFYGNSLDKPHHWLPNGVLYGHVKEGQSASSVWGYLGQRTDPKCLYHGMDSVPTRCDSDHMIGCTTPFANSVLALVQVPHDGTHLIIMPKGA